MKRSGFFISTGSMLMTVGACIFLLTFFPVIKNETLYTIRSVSAGKPQQPIDREFGIVIPKLGANARIISDVDPYDSEIYQQALTRGVAHARGTVYPGQIGNVFLFSHSSVNFYVASRYNSVFYLLSKLETGDSIDLYYRGEKYVYTVTSKTLANPDQVEYLTAQTTKKQVTLMTCWPPGTTLKRLVVTGNLN